MGASLLMSLESFFSAVGGALLLGEVMTPRGYLGCALIFLGTLLAQAPARLPKWPQR
jgi:drug/metabolite transporter (DMT)-like permease